MLAAGATLNVIVEDDKSIKDNGVIVIPGHKEKHNTVINVPGPQKVRCCVRCLVPAQ